MHDVAFLLPLEPGKFVCPDEVGTKAVYKINVSIGAAFYYPTDTFSFDELYKRADSCTYESKKADGSKVTFYKRKDRDKITDF